MVHPTPYERLLLDGALMCELGARAFCSLQDENAEIWPFDRTEYMARLSYRWRQASGAKRRANT